MDGAIAESLIAPDDPEDAWFTDTLSLVGKPAKVPENPDLPGKRFTRPIQEDTEIGFKFTAHNRADLNLQGPVKTAVQAENQASNAESEPRKELVQFAAPQPKQSFFRPMWMNGSSVKSSAPIVTVSTPVRVPTVMPGGKSVEEIKKQFMLKLPSTFAPASSTPAKKDDVRSKISKPVTLKPTFRRRPSQNVDPSTPATIPTAHDEHPPQLTGGEPSCSIVKSATGWIPTSAQPRLTTITPVITADVTRSSAQDSSRALPEINRSVGQDTSGIELTGLLSVGNTTISEVGRSGSAPLPSLGIRTPLEVPSTPPLPPSVRKVNKSPVHRNASPANTISTPCRRENENYRVNKSPVRVLSSRSGNATRQLNGHLTAFSSGADDMDDMLLKMRRQVDVYKSSILCNAEEVEKQKARIRGLEHERSLLATELKNVTIRADDEKGQYQEYRKKVATLQSNETRISATIANLGKSFEELKTLGEVNRKSTADTRATVTDLLTGVTDLQGEVDTGIRRIDRIRNNANRIVQGAKAENDSLELMIQQLRKELDRLTTSLVAEKKRAARIDDTLLTERAAIPGISEAIESMKQMLNASTQMVVVSPPTDDKLSEMRALIEACAKAIGALGEKGQLDHEVIKNGLSGVEELIRGGVQHLQRVTDTISHSSKEIHVLHADLQSSLAEYTGQLQLSRSADAGLAAAQHEKAEVTLQHLELKAKCEHLERELVTKNNETDFRNERILKLEALLASGVGKAQSTAHLDQQIAELRHQHTQLQEEHIQSAAKLVEMQTRAEKGEADASALQASAAKLKQELEASRSQLQLQKENAEGAECMYTEQLKSHSIELENAMKTRIRDLTSDHANKLRQAVVGQAEAEEKLRAFKEEMSCVTEAAALDRGTINQLEAREIELLVQNEALEKQCAELQAAKDRDIGMIIQQLQTLKSESAQQASRRERLDRHCEQFAREWIEVRTRLDCCEKQTQENESAAMDCDHPIDQAKVTEALEILVQSTASAHQTPAPSSAKKSGPPSAGRLEMIPESPVVNRSSSLPPEDLFGIDDAGIEDSLVRDEDATLVDVEMPAETKVDVVTAQEDSEGSRFFEEAFAELENSRMTTAQPENVPNGPLSEPRDLLPSPEKLLSDASRDPTVAPPKSILKKTSATALLSDEVDERSSQTSTSTELAFGGKHNRNLQTYGSASRKSSFTSLIDTAPRRRTTTDKATSFFRRNTTQSSSTSASAKPLSSAPGGKNDSLAQKAMTDFSAKREPEFLAVVGTPRKVSVKPKANETRPMSPVVPGAMKRKASVKGMGEGSAVKVAKRQRFSAEVV